MRVWIDPQKLVGFGLSIDDVSNAIRGQNVQVPAGAFGSAPGSSAQELTATLAVKGTLDDPQEFGQVVLRANQDGSLVRLADVARLELGKESYNISSRLNGTPTVGGRSSCRQGQRDPDRYPGETASRRTVGVLPRGHAVQRALRHFALRRRGHREGDPHPDRSDGPGVPGDVPVPAERPLHPDPVHRGAGVLAGYADGDVPAGVLGEHDDHVRHGPGDRHPGGRRHRGGGERRADHGGGGISRPRPRPRR